MIKKIGEVYVDTGTIMIGDPCYIPQRTEELEQHLEEMGKYCNLPALGGVAVSTGIGDGIYPVYAEIENNIVTSVTIDFLVPKEFLKKQ
jgi:hypothetical protein